MTEGASTRFNGDEGRRRARIFQHPACAQKGRRGGAREGRGLKSHPRITSESAEGGTPHRFPFPGEGFGRAGRRFVPFHPGGFVALGRIRVTNSECVTKPPALIRIRVTESECVPFQPI